MTPEMEMVFKTVRNYFEFMDQHASKWQELVVKMKNHMLIIRELTDQLRLLRKSSTDESEPLWQLPDLRHLLLQKLFVHFENEMCITNEIMNQLDEADTEAESKYKTLIQVCEQHKMEDSGRVASFCSTLIAYAEEFKCSYCVRYMKLRSAYRMVCIYDEESSVLCLRLLITESQTNTDHDRVQYLIQCLDQFH